MTNSNLTRRLILSPWYQSLWGNRFALRSDQNSKSQFDNTAGGSRIATSVGGTLLGVGGNIIVIDDPHNVADVESEAERQTALAWWAEVSTTRLNDPKQAAIVVIMQRLHEEDVSGKILASESDEDWVHLMIPMRHDPDRHCITVPVGIDQIEWEDPRTDDGELMWPERFGEAQVAAIEAGLGPYLSSGRLQQSPEPRGGGIIKRDFWQVWEPPDNKFPQPEFVLASLDGAFTQAESNDPSALTVWIIFRNREGQRRVMLVDAWRKHLQFSAPRVPMRPGESYSVWKQRTMASWGLMEHIYDSCTHIHGKPMRNEWKLNRLLVEDKGPGHSAAQELANRYGFADFGGIELVKCRGDKLSRVLAVQPTFSQGLVFAPDRAWSETVITEMMMFPHGKRDDLTDSTTQALQWLRNNGMLATDEEEHFAAMQGVMHRPPRLKPLYPI